MVKVAYLPLRDPQVVLHGSVGVEPWVLMSSCKEDCDRVPINAKTFDKSPEIATGSASDYHGHENPISGR
jgi:hypothetical protein